MNDLWNRIRNAWNRNAVISFFGVTGMGFFLSFLILAGWFSFLPFFITRMACDFLTILIGLLTGGRPTIGIILIALFLGPVITVVGRIMKKIRKNSSD